MSALPLRVALWVILPAVIGGAIGWVTRPSVSDTAGGPLTAAGPGLPPAPVVRAHHPSATGALAEQRRFCERLRGASLEQMRELLDEAQSFTDAFRRRSARELVFEHMARTDPVAAWAMMESWENGGYRGHFLNAWARVDAGAALTWAESQGENARQYSRDIVAGLVPDDVETFAKLLPRLTPEQVSTAQIETAFRLLGAGDAAQARTLMAGIADEGKRRSATASLAEGWARREAAAAYAWAQELTDPAQRESALRGVFRAWAETDPQTVAAKLDELSQDEAIIKDARGGSPVTAIVRAWAAQDPQAAAAWVREQTAAGGDGSFRELFVSEILPARDDWPATEVADLLRRPGEKLVTEKPDEMFNHHMNWGGDNGETMHSFGRFGGHNSPLRAAGEHPEDKTQGLRFADPAQAFEELSRQPGDAPRQYLLEEVAAQWVEKDPSAALTKLAATEDVGLKLGLINALSNHAQQTGDLALASEVVKAFPEGSWQAQSVVSGIYQHLARRDPEQAGALLQSDEVDESQKSNLARTLAREHVAYDPLGAITWATQQPEGTIQQSALEAAVAGWTQADAYATSEWLAEQPAGPLRESAVAAMVGALSHTAPEDALAWAATLSDPQGREQLQVLVVMNLLWRDLPKAKELAAGLELSESHRRNLQKTIEQQEK